MSLCKSIPACILASVALGCIGHAYAGDGERIRSVRVAYEDLDLETEAGAREMLARLERAAREACGRYPQRHSSYKVAPERTKAVFRECRERAVAVAVKELNVATLTKMYARSAKQDGCRRGRA